MAAELALDLASACDFPGPDKKEFLRVAQYYQMVFDPDSLRREIKDILERRKAVPSAVHRAIARLPLPLVLTTNFDNLMETAYEEVGKQPRVEWYDFLKDTPRLKAPSVKRPLVYKLHGTLEQHHTMLATEDDIIDFASRLLLREPDLPLLIKTALSEQSVLFIGYGLKDWNIRVMLRALRIGRVNTNAEVNSYAVQRRPGDEGVAQEWERAIIYWNKKESLRCFDVDAADFARDLEERFAAGVKK